MKLVLLLPQVTRTKLSRPSKCPCCKGKTFQGWGSVSRPIKDINLRTVDVPRYKCTSCKKTFQQYLKG